MGGIFKGMVAIGAECADEVKAAAGIGLIPAVPVAIVADVVAVRMSIVCGLTPTALALLWFVNVLLALMVLTAVFLPSSRGFAAFQKAVYGKDDKSAFNPFRPARQWEDE